jgi:3-dehydroquinate synthase
MLAAGDPDGLYAQRAPLYASAADIEVITDGKTPGEIADEVCAALGSVTAGLRRVAVPAPSRSYEVVVGEGIAPAAAELAPAPGAAEKCFVITHPSLSDVAGKVAASYEGAGLAAHVLTVPEGESSKSLDVAAKLFAGLAEAQAHRGDLVAGVGGGVITDLAGFVASTYARGMQVVAVPTTLLAQVDAAIGGKTGVNLPHGKNLVGTIHQPAAVLCDVAALRTLPAPEMRSGLAEVAKYGFIRDPVLVRSLAADARAIAAADPGVLIRTVVRCAGIKASVVAADEREAGLRRILNYGHTFGHAIEAARSYEGIRHGEAVAIGMVAAAYLAELLGLAGPGLAELHEETLRPLGLPVRASLDGAALERAWRRDKKFERGVRFVLLEELGRPVAGVTAPRATVMEAIERVSE